MELKLYLPRSKVSRINNLQRERRNLQREVELVIKVSSFESAAEYKDKALTLCSNFQFY